MAGIVNEGLAPRFIGGLAALFRIAAYRLEGAGTMIEPDREKDFSMSETINHFIDGRSIGGRSGNFGDVFNPATGEVRARVPLASDAEVRAAVEVAARALPAWAATPPARRARVMFAFRDLLNRHADEIAGLISIEHGKELVCWHQTPFCQTAITVDKAFAGIEGRFGARLEGR